MDPFVSDNKCCDIVEAVKLEMLEFLEESEENSTKEPQSNPPKKRKLVASLFYKFCKIKKNKKRTSAEDIVNSEVRQYVDEDLLDYDSDPLKWWSMCARISILLWLSLKGSYGVCQLQVFDWKKCSPWQAMSFLSKATVYYQIIWII